MCALALGAAPAGAAAKATPYAKPVLALSVHPDGTLQQKAAAFKELVPMGFGAIRTDFSWSSLDPSTVAVTDPADFDWAGADSTVAAARRERLSVMAILDYGNAEYSPGGDADAPPTDLTTFGTFAKDVAKRYGSRIHSFEVWNEENLGFRFWKPQADPSTYGKLLCDAYHSIKQVDPKTPVASGGVFFPSLPVGSLLIGGVPFLDQMFTDDGPAEDHCFNAVAFHPYPYPFTSPEAVVPGRGSVINAADQVRAVLDRHGVSAKVPLWDTEVGWPTNPLVTGATESFEYYNGVTTTTQAQYLVRTYLLYWQKGLPVVTFYDQFDDAEAPGQAGYQEDHFGLYDASGQPKPAVAALKNLDEELGGPGWHYAGDESRALRLPRGTDGVDTGHALEFDGPHHRRTIVLWYANERPPKGSLDSTWTDAVTPGTAPKTIKVHVGSHKGEVVRSMDGGRLRARPTLNVGQSPIYVSWTAGRLAPRRSAPSRPARRAHAISSPRRAARGSRR